MKPFIFAVVAVLVAMSVSSSYAAYNGAKNYESKPAASKASPASTSRFADSKSGGKSKSAGKSSFKSGGYKAGRR